ncbi:TetR family transcriptional regulator [Amycolatopsis antarctica]|uniref:TetR family transcriptional regulator n=1 Tax=Amycolatopsis antarctica TaxID=1854586 RepID=A0A263D2V5_9PSEU|nr:TetR/AcrR family transcriptional regulator [Amycolatopsis antarctica]OZM72802.1 TetR family transcriptional regulator [Amycolatopsis antarctica]
MDPENRRAMIVRAVLPLVAEHGATITTSQIARAAGIGEGTIFRAFTDKDELLDACLDEAFRPDQVVEALARIPLDQPLADRLAAAADALSAHLERMGALLAATHAAGRHRRNPPDAARSEDARSEDDAREARRVAKRARRERRTESFTTMRTAVAELIVPEGDGLRLPPTQLASLLLTLLMSRSRQPAEEEPLSGKEIVDVLLYGALHGETTAPGAAG